MNELSNEVLSELRDANSARGEAQAFVHVAGYTFKLGFERLTWLLKEDRWQQCGFDDIEAFADSIQFGPSMKAAAEKRKELAVLFKQADEKKPVSNDKIARALNWNRKTIDRDLATNVPPATKNANKVAGTRDKGGTNVPPTLPEGERGGSLVVGRENRKARDAAASEARIAEAASIGGEGTIDLRKGDFRAALADLQNIDAIITDPPYPREFLPLMRDLAAFADRVLKPDGVLAVLYGHTWLPEIMALMTGFRPYRWTACYLEEGAGYVSQARRVQSNWKPLLVYGGGPRFGDVFRATGDGEGKQRHPWGQNYDAFRDIIEALTLPGATVVDPFAGGGTTLFAAKALGRHAIGCDIDASATAFKIVEAA